MAKRYAIVFSVLMLLVSLFQLGLAVGMPWGHLAMGGAYPGVYPVEMRVAAVVQVVLYGALAAIVLARAGSYISSALLAAGHLVFCGPA